MRHTARTALLAILIALALPSGLGQQVHDQEHPRSCQGAADSDCTHKHTGIYVNFDTGEVRETTISIYCENYTNLGGNHTTDACNHGPA